MRDDSAELHRGRRLDWDDLRYFLAVARAGSTIAAARLLGVNQSTTSRRLATLEERLGCALFERRGGRYVATGLGTELVPLAEAVEASVEAFERAVASRDRRATGSVTVTCPEGLGYRLLSPLIDKFRDLNPGMSVNLVIADRYLDLSKGEADVAVRAGRPGDPALFGRKISDNPWAVYASRDYIARHGRPRDVSEIGRHALIGLDGSLADIHSAKWLRSVAPDAVVAVRSNSVIGLLLMVRTGIGLATLPVHIGDAEDDLERVLDPVPELNSEVWLLTHQDLRHTPRVAAFFDFVVSEVRSLQVILGGSRPMQRSVPKTDPDDVVPS